MGWPLDVNPRSRYAHTIANALSFTFFSGTQSRTDGRMVDQPHQWKQVVCLVVSLVLTAILTIFPKDFWEENPFTEWTEQEAMKLISDSPWARPLSVLGSILGARQTVTTRSSELPNLATAERGRSSGEAMSTGTAMGGKAGIGPGDPVPVYVRWLSSVRMRQALGRLGRFRVKAPESEASRFAEQRVEDYQIAVIAPIMGVFNDLSLEEFKPKTFLTSRKDKSKKIPLKSYTAPRNRSDGVALFSFPRLLDGKPVFGLEDQEVEFSAQGGMITLKAAFKLAKMMADGKPDL